MVTLPLIGLNGDNKEAFDAVFDEIDVDKNGKIEYEELLMALKRRDAVVALQSTYRGAKARRLMPHLGYPLRSGPSGSASAKKAVAAAKKAAAAVVNAPPKSARPRSIVGHVQPDAQPDAGLAAAPAAAAAAV